MKIKYFYQQINIKVKKIVWRERDIDNNKDKFNYKF